MKKTIIILLTLMTSFAGLSQEKTREVGVTIASLNNFGFTFRTGTENALWRFNSIIANGSNLKDESINNGYENNYHGFGFSVGREHRKNVSENLELRLGADLSFHYSHYSNSNSITPEETRYSPGVNLVLGFNYLIQENLFIGAEMLPHFRYQTGTRTVLSNDNGVEYHAQSKLSGFSYGLNNNSVLLSVGYRF